MAVVSRFFPPISMAEIFSLLIALSDQQFNEIESEIKSPQAFEADSERVEAISKRIGFSRDNVGFLLTFMNFIYSRMMNEATSEETRLEMIDSLVSSAELDTLENKTPEERAANNAKLKNRLLRLTVENRYAKVRRKIERLKTGFLPNAIAFSTFVDLRPMISEDRSSVDGFVPVVQLRISTEQADVEDTTVVQLDEKALKKLSEAVQDADKKLQLLKTDDFFKPRIVN